MSPMLPAARATDRGASPDESNGHDERRTHLHPLSLPRRLHIEQSGIGARVSDADLSALLIGQAGDAHRQPGEAAAMAYPNGAASQKPAPPNL